MAKIKLTSTNQTIGTVEVGYIENGKVHLEPVIETIDYKIELCYNLQDKTTLIFYYQIIHPKGTIGLMGNDENVRIHQNYLNKYINR